MKLLAIIVTYKPNIDELTKNITSFIDFVDRLIIWKNSDWNNESFGKHSILENNSKIEFGGTGENIGIAFALNRAIDLLFQDKYNYTHLLTMDQDSTWINFEEYYNKVNNLETNSIYSPIINDQPVSDVLLLNVKTCITSGTIFSKEVLKIIGNFNETYSVDCVDYDFSFKARLNNIKIKKVQGCNMNQIYGDPLKSKYFNLETNCYPPNRLFFIVRNHILLWKDYPKQLDFQFKKMILNSYIFGKIVKIILMEDNKIKKVISILNGLICGLMNNRKKRY